MDTNTSLRKFANAIKPVTSKGQPPLADEVPVCMPVPAKDEWDPTSKRQMDLSWISGEGERKTWKSKALYKWSCKKRDKLYTQEEYVAAYFACSTPECNGEKLVGSADGPQDIFRLHTAESAFASAMWKKPLVEGIILKPAAVRLRPAAQPTGRSSSLPAGALPDWTLGQGKKATLKSSRNCWGGSSSLPPVDEERDPAKYQWSRGQWDGAAEASDNVELADSQWDQQIRNPKMVLQFQASKRNLSLVESAAYTACRRQIEDRGWSGNLEVGLVAVVETLTPEQLEQSKVSKFKPELGVIIGGAAGRSYE